MLIALALLFAADPAPFVSKECKFSIAFPAKPESTERTVKGVTTRSFQFMADDLVYVVNHAVLPSKSGHTPKELFDAAINRLKRAGRKVTLNKEDHFGEKKHPSRVIEANNGVDFVRMRFVSVGDRMYQVSVAGEEEFLKSPKAKAFFESFAIDP